VRGERAADFVVLFTTDTYSILSKFELLTLFCHRVRHLVMGSFQHAHCIGGDVVLVGKGSGKTSRCSRSIQRRCRMRRTRRSTLRGARHDSSISSCDYLDWKNSRKERRWWLDDDELHIYMYSWRSVLTQEPQIEWRGDINQSRSWA
jgi:hypothetical protein